MKKIGINIDGIIRDSFTKFDIQYRKVFIHNPCLVAMNEDDMTMREFTDAEMDEIDRKIEEKESEIFLELSLLLENQFTLSAVILFPTSFD